MVYRELGRGRREELDDLQTGYPPLYGIHNEGAERAPFITTQTKLV
jgi:hypothetical protein